MKFISNIILIIFCSIFTNFFALYANEIEYTDKTSNEFIEKTRIVKKVFKWIKKNKKVPTIVDFDFDLSIAGRYKDIYLKFNDGITGELKEMLIDYDKKGEILKFILNSTLSQKYWFNTPGKKEKLQNVFIKFIILPWIEKNQRFPTLEDYGLNENQLGVTYYKFFGIGRLFSNQKELKEKLKNYLPQELYSAYIDDEKIITDLAIEKERIARKVFNWMKRNKRFPTTQDFKHDLSIGEQYDYILKIFNNETKGELKEILLDLDKKGEITNIILQSHLSQEYWFENNTEKRKKLKETFIRFGLIPWFDKHKRYPDRPDFKAVNPSYIGFSYPKVFNISSVKIGFFNDASDFLKSFIIYIIGKDPSTIKDQKELEQIINNPDVKKYLNLILLTAPTRDCYEDESLIKIFQFFIIKEYFLPYMETYQEYPTYEDFTQDISIKVQQLDLNIRNTSETIKSRLFNFFKNKSSIIKYIMEIDSEKKYYPYILQSYLSEEIYQDEVIRKELKHFFVKNILFSNIDKNNKFPTNLVQSGIRSTDLYIKYDKIIRIYGRLGLFENRKDLIKNIIELDPTEKYLKYVLQVRIFDDIYQDQDMVLKFRRVFIKDFLCPWIIRNNGIFPHQNDFTSEKEKVGISYHKISKLFGDNTNTRVIQNIKKEFLAFCENEDNKDIVIDLETKTQTNYQDIISNKNTTQTSSDNSNNTHTTFTSFNQDFRSSDCTDFFSTSD